MVGIITKKIDAKIRIHIQKPLEQRMSFRVKDILITPKSIKKRNLQYFFDEKI